MQPESKIPQRIYLVGFILLLLLIIANPLLINQDIRVIGNLNLEHEILQVGIVAVLVLAGYFVFQGYEDRIKAQEQELQKMSKEMADAYKYIGAVNVQMEQIKSISSALSKIPESRTDFKKVLDFFGEKTLGIVNTDWVLLRIIDADTLNTLKEQIIERHPRQMTIPEVPNRIIAKQGKLREFSYVSSDHINLDLKIFIIVPKTELDKNQQILLKALVDELSMLYIIYAAKNHLAEE